MIFYKQCYLGLFTTVFTILELTQNVLATDCDTFSKIVKNMGETTGGGAYVTFTDCCKAAGVTCDANQNIIELSFSKFSGYGGNMNGFYQELQNLTSLTSLEIVDCKIGDSLEKENINILPKTIGNLKNLKTLIIRDSYIDYFGFSLPEEIGNLINLEKLDLSHNQLTGPLPKSIGNLKNLKILILNQNNFNETIPYEFKNLQNLEEINLFSNSNLKGYIPPLPKLKTCDYGMSGLCKLPGTCGDYVDVCTTDEIKNYNIQNGNPNQSENVGFFSSFNNLSKFIPYVFIALIFLISLAITMCIKCTKKPKYESQPHLEQQNSIVVVGNVSPLSPQTNNNTTTTIENDKVPLNTTYSDENELLPAYSLIDEQKIIPSPEKSTSNAPLKNYYSAYAAMNTSMNTLYIPSAPSPAVTVPPVGYAPQPAGYTPPPTEYIPNAPAESEYKK